LKKYNSTLLVALLHFCRHTKPNKKCKRATKPTHQDRHEMTAKRTTEKEGRRHNTGLAKVAVQFYAYTFVINQNLVLRINICGENRRLRQARKR